MPIETTSDAVRPLAAARKAAGNAKEPSRPRQSAIEKVRGSIERTLAFAMVLLSRLRSKRRPRSLSRTMTVLGWIAVMAMCGYVGLTAMIYLTQRSLMYFPERTHVTPAEAGLPEATEVPLTTADGVQIRVWHVPPKAGNPVILYFHGNGGALNYRVERFRQLISCRHRLGRAGISRLWRLGRQPERARPDRATPKRPMRSPPRIIRRNRSSCGANRSAPEWRLRWRRKNRSAASSWKRRSPRRSPSANAVIGICRCGF